MKTLILVFLSIVSMQAFADSGLECTMAYKTSSPFSSAESSETRWLSEGQKMKGTATSEEFSLKSGAHYVSVKKTTMNRGQNGWTVRVYDNLGVDLGIVEFREDAAMKVSYPVKAWATESEDPSEFDLLEVSCHYTVFAG
jgi:hypothetical protein